MLQCPIIFIQHGIKCVRLSAFSLEMNTLVTILIKIMLFVLKIDQDICVLLSAQIGQPVQMPDDVKREFSVG